MCDWLDSRHLAPCAVYALQGRVWRHATGRYIRNVYCKLYSKSIHVYRFLWKCHRRRISCDEFDAEALREGHFVSHSHLYVSVTGYSKNRWVGSLELKEHFSAVVSPSTRLKKYYKIHKFPLNIGTKLCTIALCIMQLCVRSVSFLSFWLFLNPSLRMSKWFLPRNCYDDTTPFHGWKRWFIL